MQHRPSNQLGPTNILTILIQTILRQLASCSPNPSSTTSILYHTAYNATPQGCIIDAMTFVQLLSCHTCFLEPQIASLQQLRGRIATRHSTME